MLSSVMSTHVKEVNEMDRIPPWIINKGGKIILKNGQKQVEGGDDPHGTNQTVPGLGTVRGTNGAEVETDPYSNWARGLGWDQFDYNAFTAAVHRNMNAGMKAEDATNAAAAELIRSNPSLADQAEKSAQGVQPSAKSRDSAQPLAGDIIKEMNAKADGPTARQIEADVARYLEAGFPPGAAAAMARQNAQQDLEKEQLEKRDLPPEPQEPPKGGEPPQGPFLPPQEGKVDGGPQEQQQAQAEMPQPEPDQQPTSAPAQDASEPPADPQVAAMVEMASKPVDNPGRAALLKPVENLTQPEMMDMINHAQGDYRGWRSGDPLKYHTYEKVQDWHAAMYGDGPQQYDGGKPIEPTPIRPIPEQPSPHVTPQGGDLWQATAKIGQQVADAAGTDGYAQAVTGLQRGLNMLNQANPLPKRSPAYAPYTGLGPVDEDGKYGPQTDFALKHATARLGSAKVEEGLALGRFNTFARDAQRNGNPDGLEDKTHSIFGPLFRGSGDDKSPKVEGGVLQETLNDLGSRKRDDWEPLKVDNWIGPKTTQAFGTVLADEDADSLTRSFGRGLGLL
ncbi:MAG: hypothetical protein HQL42_19840 [Alphaproteobacteria bacterium]|nr:hypothetical protein [Alphaproteobacteria bacterium]